MKENYLAIALGKIDLGETDRFYTFYTREAGMMRISAKGIRKSSARLAPHVEDFLITQITVAKNYGTGTLAGAITEEAFFSVQENLDAMLVLMYVRDLFVRMIHGTEPDQILFDLWRDFLRVSEAYSKRKPEASIFFLAAAFLMKVFHVLGYGGATRQCGTCHQRIALRHYRYHPGYGMLCRVCATHKNNTITIKRHTAVFLHVVRTHSLHDVSKVIVTADVEKELRNVVTQTQKWILF